MSIIYIHGIAVRNKHGDAENDAGSTLVNHFMQDVEWPAIQTNLRQFVAPAISSVPDGVAITQAYWGDLGAHLAWSGASFLSKDSSLPPLGIGGFTSLFRSKVAADLRPPLDNMIALFMGDVFCYLSKRGNVDAPGDIPMRVLEHLMTAQAIKDKTGEPLVVLSYSMGCEIIYDILTYFLPNIDKFGHIKIDYWCGAASQVGLFEELKLFLNSSDNYGRDHNNRVPFPNRNHLGYWWNVWDPEDFLSYSVHDIIENVDDSRYLVGKSLFSEHLGYLLEKRFYETLAEWIRSKTPELPPTG
jgi:hypothetical protein